MRRLFLLFTLALLAQVMVAVENTDTMTVRIKGMRCEECAHKVKNILNKVGGVEKMRFNLERRTVTIDFDAQLTNRDSIKANLARTGRYKASPYDAKEPILRGIGLKIDDMHCQKCANRIMDRLAEVEGIDSIGPNVEKHYVFFRYDANKTSKGEIRDVLGRMGFTPVNYYTSKNISFAYFNIPVEQTTEETIETALALDGVDDANVCQRQKSLAITYVNTETTAEKLLEHLQAEGIKAVVPKPHECEEEKKQ